MSLLVAYSGFANARAMCPSFETIRNWTGSPPLREATGAATAPLSAGPAVPRLQRAHEPPAPAAEAGHRVDETHVVAHGLTVGAVIERDQRVLDVDHVGDVADLRVRLTAG